VVFWKGKKKSPILALGIAWFLIAFLPVLNFVPTHPVVADRYAFLPLAGCAMIFAVLVTQTGKWTFQTLGLGLAVIVAASGFSLYRTAAWRSDIDLWRSAIKANNNSGRVELAQALWRRDRYQEALEQLEIERDLAGSHYYNFYAGGFAMMNGQTDRAITLFKAALAEGGEAYSDVHLKLAEAYEQAGEPELALEHYLKTLQTENMDFFSRDRQEAQSAIDRIWKEMGPEMATRKRDAVNHPEDFLKQAQAAVYFYSVGKYDDAETFYLSALELAPSSWEAWHNLGLTYMKTLDYDAAINAFRTALEYNPGNTNSLNNLAISYDKTDRQDMAIRTYRRALDADPQFFFAAFNLGRIYFSQGDLDNAREYLLYARSLIASDDPRRRRVALYLSEIGGG
jgi:tetratricopeptide (TPR) repeat protein